MPSFLSFLSVSCLLLLNWTLKLATYTTNILVSYILLVQKFLLISAVWKQSWFGRARPYTNTMFFKCFEGLYLPWKNCNQHKVTTNWNNDLPWHVPQKSHDQILRCFLYNSLGVNHRRQLQFRQQQRIRQVIKNNVLLGKGGHG